MDYKQVLFNKMRVSEDVLNKQPEEVQKYFKKVLKNTDLPETEALARAKAQVKIDELKSKYRGPYKPGPGEGPYIGNPSKLVALGKAIDAEKRRRTQATKEMREKFKSLKEREKNIPALKRKKGGSISKSKKPRGIGAAQRGYGKALTGRKK